MKGPTIIDRNSYEPAYLQLANILRQRIARGEFREGKPLPSESKLCSQYQISPMTVRRAVNLLSRQGIVSTTKGRGTFVKPLQLQSITFNLDEFTSLFQSEAQAQVRILHAGITRASQEVAEKLDIGLGERAVHITSLITQKGGPLIYHWEYLFYDPSRPIVEAEIEVTALQGLFSGGESSQLKSGEMNLEAMVLDAETAAILGVGSGSAALHLTHLFYDFNNQPVSWGGYVCRADKMQLSTSFGADMDAPQNK